MNVCTTTYMRARITFAWWRKRLRERAGSQNPDSSPCMIVPYHDSLLVIDLCDVHGRVGEVDQPRGLRLAGSDLAIGASIVGGVASIALCIASHVSVCQCTLHWWW